MSDYFKNWEKEKDKSILYNDINYKVKSLYMNKEIEKVHEIFNSKWKDYIDLSYDNGSILEFAAMIKDSTKEKAVDELKYLIEDIEYKNIDKQKFHRAIHNILLSSVTFNNMNMIRFITKEQNLCTIDFSYAKCGIISNCFPKNNNPVKKDIMNYFIMECNLRRTPEIEKFLIKNKRTDIITVFEKIEFYQKLSQKLPDNKEQTKKIKL